MRWLPRFAWGVVYGAGIAACALVVVLWAVGLSRAGW